MILPTKHIPVQNSLLFIGGEVLSLLGKPKTISRIWQEISKKRNSTEGRSHLSYEWFILSVDLLYLLGAVELNNGKLYKRSDD